MEDIVGKVVNLEEGEIIILEQVIAYKHVLDKAMDRILKEARDNYINDMSLWEKMQGIAKEQYTDYDPNIHILSYNWPTRALTIQTIEQKRKGLLD